MKISYRRLRLVVFLIVVWNRMWLLSPHTVGSRGCVDGVCWECKQILPHLSENDRTECLKAIKGMEGVCK